MGTFVVIKLSVCVKFLLGIRIILYHGMFQQFPRHGTVKAFFLPLGLGMYDSPVERQNSQLHQPYLKLGKAGTLRGSPRVSIVAEK